MARFLIEVDDPGKQTAPTLKAMKGMLVGKVVVEVFDDDGALSIVLAEPDYNPLLRRPGDRIRLRLGGE